MQPRRRFKQSLSPTELDLRAARLRARAKTLSRAPEPGRLIGEARQVETAMHVEKRLSSRGLEGPR
jgi:hypothetical protein